MNNTDFRRIFVAESSEDSRNRSSSGATSTTTGSLGSRIRSSIPLTPRTVKGQPPVDFRRQVAEHNASSQTSRRFRASAAPKGAKLAPGYTDRVLNRNADAAESEQDDRESRLRALEEQVKLGQIERQVFEEMREQITGGDVAATHLVKGLDRKLLERVRRGEDVLSTEANEPTHPPAPILPAAENQDEEFEKLEQREIAPLERQNVVKKGEMAPPSTGTKRSRADILAELKASRQAAQQASAQSQLRSRFSRIGAGKVGSRTEKDAQGREVLITVDAEGRVKRKVKKTAETQQAVKHPSSLLMPDASVKPMGMVLPTVGKSESVGDDIDDIDIFENVGSNYDPLGDAELSDDSSSDEDFDQVPQKVPASTDTSPTDIEKLAGEDSHPEEQRRNYFGDAVSAGKQSQPPTNPLHDPTIVAALKKAATLRPDPSSTLTSVERGERNSDTQSHRLLNTRDRDMEDLDLGFGSSRFDDDDDEGPKKLSEWKAGPSGEDGKQERPSKRKRGKKHRQGDKESAVDILNVIERRKATSR